MYSNDSRSNAATSTTTCLDAHLVACPPKLRRALVDAGFNNVHDVCHLSAMDLARELGTTPEEAQQVIDLAKTKAVGAYLGNSVTFRTALELFENPCERIPLGIPRLDAALGGGISAGQVTEICGPPGAGKTQISMLLSVTAIAGGGSTRDSAAGRASCSDRGVLYIDTEGSFVPERVEEIARGVLGSEAATRQLLSQIQYVRVHSQVEQLALVSDLASHLERNRNIKLVVLDSVAFHMRSGATSTSGDKLDFSKRQHSLANMFHLLTKLAVENKCCVWVTNHITVRKAEGGDGAKVVPALGDLWAHVPAERFFVWNTDDFRGLLLHKSPSSPQVLVDLNRETGLFA
ncbi:DNA repair protein Rad51 [Chloropicon primus]|uniref:DNA repair protein RAD51 homolog 3 n=1 Tax=Chloropicon primus TaxID=1764295 RepID=A0A5B8MYW7_9CHLO|nr:DNA repair protein Rad51 [Chloropicon primus]UPR04451.1 DNA repair protein Rad51 [Chloropicon primus]|eukprot:QDZ25246.1 DNA repair protein Rad51 [Chloropicon primus]